jgi:hypothetical protein
LTQSYKSLSALEQLANHPELSQHVRRLEYHRYGFEPNSQPTDVAIANSVLVNPQPPIDWFRRHTTQTWAYNRELRDQRDFHGKLSSMTNQGQLRVQAKNENPPSYEGFILNFPRLEVLSYNKDWTLTEDGYYLDVDSALVRRTGVRLLSRLDETQDHEALFFLLMNAPRARLELLSMSWDSYIAFAMRHHPHGWFETTHLTLTFETATLWWIFDGLSDTMEAVMGRMSKLFPRLQELEIGFDELPVIDETWTSSDSRTLQIQILTSWIFGCTHEHLRKLTLRNLLVKPAEFCNFVLKHQAHLQGLTIVNVHDSAECSRPHPPAAPEGLAALLVEKTELNDVKWLEDGHGFVAVNHSIEA